MESENKVGAPAIWDDPKEFEEAVNNYFNDTEIIHTWSGLALHLGFESRQSLQDYKKKPEFSYSIKNALLRIEAMYEERLHKAKNPAGSIFALKNFGWKDKQEIDHKVSTGFLNVDPLDDSADDSPKEDSPS